MNRRLSVIIPVFAVAFLLSGGSVRAVELTVENPLEVPRVGEPVTVGLPFPAGYLYRPEELTLLDDRGGVVPLQARAVASWADGSVMWSLLDFPVSLAAGSGRVYRLETGRLTEPGQSPLRVESTDSTLAVVTGPLRLALGRGSGPLIRGIWLDWDQDREFGTLEQAAAPPHPGVLAGRDASSGRLFSEAWGSREDPVIEEAGRQKVQVLAAGTLADSLGNSLLEYQCRVFLFAGSSSVRLQLTVRNPRIAGQRDDRWLLGGEGSFFFDNLSLSLGFVSGREPPQVVLGSLFDGAGFEARQIPLERTLAIRQESSGGDNWFHRNHVDRHNLIPLGYKGYRVCYGERVISAGDRPEPWAAVEDSRKGMAAAVSGFWQNFPKALQVGPRGLVEVGLWPGREGGPHELQGGEQKTHEVVLYLQSGQGPGERFDHWSTVAMRSFHRPLHAWAPSQWYLDSGVFGPGVEYDPQRLQDYELQAQAPVMDPKYNVFKAREFTDEYGWRNYGDFLADNEPDETHGPNKGKLTLSHWNLAFDYAWGMILQCVRTRTRAPEISDLWWRIAGEGARHQSDIDTYHAELDEEGRFARGGKFFHTHHGVNAGRATHRGSPEEELWDGLDWPWGRGVNCIDPFFFDSRGMAYYALISGDRQVLRSVLDRADLVEYKVSRDKDPQIDNFNRQAGNCLQVLTDAWIITRDERYRRAADEVVERSMASRHGIGPGHDPAEVGIDGLGFHSIFFDALGRYVEVSDKAFGIRQERAMASLADYTRFVLQYCWDDSAGIFYHALGKGLKGSRNTGVWTYRVCDALLYALPLLESGKEKNLLLERTARAFRTAGRIIQAGVEDYRFVASKNSNFIINAGPRCAYYMLTPGAGSGN
ncbi:MAG: hypothetical protein JXQ83_04080 [Candidatus Glassbacteria bacterium]|nr:hypothetical protein [Candidatus Glassbacteria bacterium]